jgi:hypothetical protein
MHSDVIVNSDRLLVAISVLYEKFNVKGSPFTIPPGITADPLVKESLIVPEKEPVTREA